MQRYLFPVVVCSLLDRPFKERHEADKCRVQGARYPQELKVRVRHSQAKTLLAEIRPPTSTSVVQFPSMAPVHKSGVIL